MFPHGGGTVVTATSWDNLVDAFNVWANENAMNFVVGLACFVVILMAIVMMSMENHDRQD